MTTTMTTTVHKQAQEHNSAAATFFAGEEKMQLRSQRAHTPPQEKGDRHIKISKAPAVFPGNPNKQH
jgi:hypothetical protein